MLSRTLLPMNFCGLVGTSMLHEWYFHTARTWLFFAAASGAYVASAFLRRRWAPERSSRPEALAADYEIAATASAGLLAMALIQRFDGTSATLALLLEAELVVLAGVALGSMWIGRVGAVLLALSAIHVLAVDAATPGRTVIGGLRLAHWTPVGVLLAGVLALNRWFFPGGWYFAAAAGAVVTAIATVELPELWVAPAVACGGVGLLASRRADLVWMSLPALVYATARAAMVNVDAGHVLTTGLVVAALYAAQRLWPEQVVAARALLSLLGTALLTLFVYEKAHGHLLTISLGIEGGCCYWLVFCCRIARSGCRGWRSFYFASASCSSTICANLTPEAEFSHSSCSASC